MFEVSSLFLDNLHLVCRFGKLYGPGRVSTGRMMRDGVVWLLENAIKSG